MNDFLVRLSWVLATGSLHKGAPFRLKLQKFMLIPMYPTGGYQGIRESYVVQTRPYLGPDLHLLAKEQSISRHEGDISRLRACL